MSFASHFLLFPRLETPRLILRDTQLADAPAYFAQVNHAQVRCHYGTADCPERRSLAGVREILASAAPISAATCASTGRSASSAPAA